MLEHRVRVRAAARLHVADVRGLRMSLMSKMRMPRRRSALTASLHALRAAVEASFQPLARDEEQVAYTDTSLCDAGQTNPSPATGRRGLEMSQTWKPL
jgi:hypothetical protein